MQQKVLLKSDTTENSELRWSETLFWQIAARKYVTVSSASWACFRVQNFGWHITQSAIRKQYSSISRPPSWIKNRLKQRINSGTGRKTRNIQIKGLRKNQVARTVNNPRLEKTSNGKTKFTSLLIGKSILPHFLLTFYIFTWFYYIVID